ncbi:MAG: shikimate kinase [Limisphaerales bacterium]
MNAVLPRHVYNLALVGFMGTGKSSVARLACEYLQFDFLDTDELIESQTGKSIGDIFAQNGEEAFRGLERNIVQDLALRRNTVIATGGGLIVNPDNLASLKTHALVVCLWASPEIIWERVRSQTHRPLLQTPDPIGRIHQLLEERKPAYHQADAMILTDHRPPKEVVQQVLHHFHLARKGQ